MEFSRVIKLRPNEEDLRELEGMEGECRKEIEEELRKIELQEGQ